MTKPQEQSNFFHSIVLNDVVKQCSSMMGKILHYGGNRIKRPLTPTLIYLDIPSNVTQMEVVAIRKFLHGLRTIHKTHFVRFVAPIQWLAESGTDDVFYSRESSDAMFYDAVITFSNILGKVVDVRVYMPHVTAHHEFLRSMSAAMLRPIACSDARGLEERYQDVVHKFHTHTQMAVRIRELKESCYILMIPDRDHTEFHLLPVWAIDKDDAKRRYRACRRTFETISRLNSEFVKDTPDDRQVVFQLAEMLHDLIDDKDRHSAAKEIYGICELLLGFYFVTQERRRISVPTKQLILIDLPIEDHGVDDELKLQMFNNEESEALVLVTLDIRDVRLD